MRKRVNLNFNWYYTPHFKETYIHQTDEKDLKVVNLPHTNIECPYNYFDEKDFQFESTYIKIIDLDDFYQNKKILLHFEGVMCYAEVYLNGQLMGTHKGGYTPFTLDITEVYQFNKENRLVIKVDSSERSDIPPYGHVVDYLTYGGIYREVYLEVVETTYIEKVFIKTKKVLEDKKILDLFIKFNQPLHDEYYIVFKLLYKHKLIQTFKHSLASKDKELKECYEVKDVLLWDIKQPNLYDLDIELYKKNELIDVVKERFGFREIEFRPDGFYLNQKKIKLRGLNRHQSYPYVGYAMPKRAQYEDAEILKNQLGVNIVRLSHYPQSKHFLNRCDELGLLVFSEIPGWQYIGNDDWKEVVKNNVREMIINDYNHPSIILWGVRINESKDDDALYQETNRIARSIDDTRPTGGVRNFSNSHFFEDVYTYNDFIHSGWNQGLNKRKKVIKKNVPYLVTEHNGHMFPTKKFDQEKKRIEHALRHLRVLNDMYKSKDISGAIGWCMVDYNTHKDFGSGDKICYHGVMDMFRTEKMASYAYLSQQEEEDVMYVSSEMNIGEYDASKLPHVYIFTNCDYVELYKNNEYINTFYPDRKAFKYLPHPPIIVNDFIGEQLYQNESFSKKDAERIKSAFYLMIRKDKLSLRDLLKIGLVMIKTRLSYQKAYDLYTKYVVNWGSESLKYHFKGYRNNQLVCETIKGPSARSNLIVTSHTFELIEDETYDVTRIELKAVDENGNLLTYNHDAIEVQIEGPLEVIGPKQFSLIGGSRAFWVKTVGKSGKGHIIIKSLLYETKSININIIKQ